MRTSLGKSQNSTRIQGPNLRPLDLLFWDHFLQPVLKNMKDAREDHEDALGGVQ